MKTKRVNRYYCDYCKFSRCHSPTVKKHEIACTKNPNRHCGMCELAGYTQTPMHKLVQLLPDPNKHICKDEYGEWYNFGMTLDVALVALRAITNDCPACILAAVRIAGIPPACVTGFNFRGECNAFLCAHGKQLISDDDY